MFESITVEHNETHFDKTLFWSEAVACLVTDETVLPPRLAQVEHPEHHLVDVYAQSLRRLLEKRGLLQETLDTSVVQVPQ